MQNKYLEKALLLEKLAATEPKEHTKRVLKKLDKTDSLIVAHSMGSGKTLTALLAAQKNLKAHKEEHVTMVVPASLVTNVYSQAKEHGVELDPERFHVVSYEKAIRDPELASRKHSLVILDEAHKIRNEGTQRSDVLKPILKASRKTMFLTGTPSYNKPHDLAVLINAAAGKNVLPADEKKFNDRYIGVNKTKPGFFARNFLGVQPGEQKFLKNQKELREILKQHIDTYDAQHDMSEEFPTVTHRTHEIEMAPDQEQVYKFLEGKLPRSVRWKIRLGMPLSKQESASLNAFSSGVRQASNSIRPFSKNSVMPSAKHIAMANSVSDKIKDDPNYRGFSYSNYVGSGLEPLSEQLEIRKIPHALYTGELSRKEKDAIVDMYNKGEIKHLLISSSGAEGLNLKGTKLAQIMEPHFNGKKIDQVVARGVRYKSHAHLPKEERHVEVEHYHSVLKPGIIDRALGRRVKSIDQYLHEVSKDKSKIQDEMMEMTKAASNNKYLSRILEEGR